VTAWALTVAAGDAGRASDAAAAAQAGYPVPLRSFVIISDAHITALLLAGHIAEAQGPAEMLLQRTVNFPAWQFVKIGNAVAGRAALGAGRLDTACSQLESVVERLFGSDETNGWGYRCQIPLTIALAMRGLTDEAVAALATLDERRHPSWRFLDYEYAIAEAWVTAGQGAVSQAFAIVLAAAETARTNEQFAPEVMCLQTATQFGDGSAASRLRELEGIVEGPRAGVAARFATALHAGDGAELAAVSEDFERMGDLVAAIDAAAHAAVAYRRQDRRGSALRCATRAERLAKHCGGASTPALRQASQRLPLTDREREIVMLLGEGLTSPSIAQRLTLSVRTVEGHIYRAMGKTGVSSRGELAALLRRREPKPCRKVASE
jgi:DNA-binding CsgD family transcriptional regulator